MSRCKSGIVQRHAQVKRREKGREILTRLKRTHSFKLQALSKANGLGAAVTSVWSRAAPQRNEWTGRVRQVRINSSADTALLNQDSSTQKRERKKWYERRPTKAWQGRPLLLQKHNCYGTELQNHSVTPRVRANDQVDDCDRRGAT